MNYFLFARPSFVGGTAHILDFGNTLFVYNDSPTPEFADYMALKNDWILVGSDLRFAIREVARDDSVLQSAGVG